MIPNRFRKTAAPPRENPERIYPARPLLAVSIAVFRDGRILLATRTRPPFVGLFSLPGGLVEAGETLTSAALRELGEEVGVKARIVAFNRHVEAIDRDEQGKVMRHYVIASFCAEWRSGEGSPGPEAGEILWADPASLSVLNCAPLTCDVVAAAQAILERR